MHELFTPSELLGGLRCPAVVVNRKWKGQSKIVGSAARWTAVELDGQLTLISAHLPNKASKLGEFEATLTARVPEWEAQTTCDLGWRLQCDPVWYDRLSPCWRVDPETENVDRHERFIACESPTMVTELDLTVTNTWMNADTERELFTRSSWSNPEDSLTQMDFIVTSSKLEMKHVKVLDSDWFKTDHRAVYAVLSLRPKMRYTMTNAANLRGWVPDDSWHDAAVATLTDWLERVGTFACGNCEGPQKDGIQGDVRDRNGAQNTSVEKEEHRSIPRTIRTELSRNLEKEKSIETRGAPGQDQGECRDGESTQENAEQAFQLEINCKRRKSRICSHKILPRPLLNLSRTGGVNPIRETTLGGAVENMRIDCAGGMLISPKKLENVLKKLKRWKGSPDQITAAVLKALPPKCLEQLVRSLSLMCWNMDFPEDWL